MTGIENASVIEISKKIKERKYNSIRLFYLSIDKNQFKQVHFKINRDKFSY
jgi:hypothetical protein